MISIVVDGRNDGHGYNLHKRAAISLNAMAALLAEDGDEIVFVDWNTPDDFPTFPEAIADLLTDRARRRLRVLRVRPALHRRLAFLADTVLLDAVARNVGFRRTDPANRWVLSTTTDMVLVPAEEGTSLSAIAGSLPDGFHGLPRFEVPEALWESLDRLDSTGILAALRAWGPRFHLDEAVRGGAEAVYDNCGDFQLALRADLFAVHGMDERMIVGWQHSDTSLQKRLALLRGGVSPLTGRLRGYHCDHTRQATAVHAAGRLENDWDLFVAPVAVPDLPFQAADWGLPDEPIEEIRLDPRGAAARRAGFAAALEAALPAGGRAPFATDRGHDAFNAATVPVAHVLPFLADHLATLPPDAVVAAAGVNPPLLAGLAAVLRALGRGGRLRVAAGPLQAAGLVAPAAAEIGTATDPAGWREAAAVLLFDFSLPEENGPIAVEEAPPEQQAGLLAVRRLFLDSVAEEKRRLAAEVAAVPRKLVAVNAIHTAFEPLVGNALDAVATPFGTRIRHGHVRGAGGGKPTRAELSAHLAGALRRPAAAAEMSRALGLIAILRRGEPPPSLEPEFGSPVVAALLSWERLPAMAGLAPERLERLRSLAAAARRLRPLATTLPELVRLDPGSAATPAASKLCDSADWDRPAWRRWNGWYTGQDGPTPFHQRNRGIWERVHMVQALDRAGVLRPGARVAVLLAQPDDLYLRLTELGVDVDVLTPWPLEGGTAALEDAWTRRPVLADRDRLRFDFGGLDAPDPAGRRYNAVLVPVSGVLAQGLRSFVRHLAFAQARLAEHGVLVFSAEVALAAVGPHPWFDWSWAAGDGLATVLRQHSRLLMEGPFDGRLSPESLDHWAERNSPRVHGPHLVLIDGGCISTTGVWVCRRRAGEAAVDRDRLLLALQRSMGPLLRRLAVVGAGRRTDGAVALAADSEPGPFLHGTGIALPGGSYRLSLRGTGAPAVEDGREALCVWVGPTGGREPLLLWRGRAGLFRGSWEIVLPLELPDVAAGGLYDLALLGLGGVALRVEAVDLVREDG